MIHNGVSTHVGRLIQLDSNAPATKAALAGGYITATITTATVFDDGIGSLQQYTVQSAAVGRLLYNGVAQTNAAHINLDPLEPQTISLVARGLIV